MTWHAFTEYMKYLRKAKGRHGVHSPFVYRFVEEVLRSKAHSTLTEKMTAFFQQYGMALTTETEKIAGIKKDTHMVIAIPGIHTDASRTAAWRALTAGPAVTLSIDLYHTGLLFYHTDFKEKQHFTLK